MPPRRKQTGASKKKNQQQRERDNAKHNEKWAVEKPHLTPLRQLVDVGDLQNFWQYVVDHDALLYEEVCSVYWYAVKKKQFDIVESLLHKQAGQWRILLTLPYRHESTTKNLAHVAVEANDDVLLSQIFYRHYQHHEYAWLPRYDEVQQLWREEDNEGRTPLALAVSLGRHTLVRILLGEPQHISCWTVAVLGPSWSSNFMENPSDYHRLLASAPDAATAQALKTTCRELLVGRFSIELERNDTASLGDLQRKMSEWPIRPPLHPNSVEGPCGREGPGWIVGDAGGDWSQDELRDWGLACSECASMGAVEVVEWLFNHVLEDPSRIQFQPDSGQRGPLDRLVRESQLKDETGATLKIPLLKQCLDLMNFFERCEYANVYDELKSGERWDDVEKPGLKVLEDEGLNPLTYMFQQRSPGAVVSTVSGMVMVSEYATQRLQEHLVGILNPPHLSAAFTYLQLHDPLAQRRLDAFKRLCGLMGQKHLPRLDLIVRRGRVQLLEYMVAEGMVDLKRSAFTVVLDNMDEGDDGDDDDEDSCPVCLVGFSAVQRIVYPCNHASCMRCTQAMIATAARRLANAGGDDDDDDGDDDDNDGTGDDDGNDGTGDGDGDDAMNIDDDNDDNDDDQDGDVDVLGRRTRRGLTRMLGDVPFNCPMCRAEVASLKLEQIDVYQTLMSFLPPTWSKHIAKHRSVKSNSSGGNDYSNDMSVWELLLIIAVDSGSLAIVEALCKSLHPVASAADVLKFDVRSIRFRMGDNLAHVAVRRSRSLVLYWFKANGYESLFWERNEDGVNALQLALSLGRLEESEYLWQARGVGVRDDTTAGGVSNLELLERACGVSEHFESFWHREMHTVCLGELVAKLEGGVTRAEELILFEKKHNVIELANSSLAFGGHMISPGVQSLINAALSRSNVKFLAWIYFKLQPDRKKVLRIELAKSQDSAVQELCMNIMTLRAQQSFLKQLSTRRHMYEDEEGFFEEDGEALDVIKRFIESYEKFEQMRSELVRKAPWYTPHLKDLVPFVVHHHIKELRTLALPEAGRIDIRVIPPPIALILRSGAVECAEYLLGEYFPKHHSENDMSMGLRRLLFAAIGHGGSGVDMVKCVYQHLRRYDPNTPLEQMYNNDDDAMPDQNFVSAMITIFDGNEAVMHFQEFYLGGVNEKEYYKVLKWLVTESGAKVTIADVMKATTKALTLKSMTLQLQVLQLIKWMVELHDQSLEDDVHGETRGGHPTTLVEWLLGGGYMLALEWVCLESRQCRGDLNAAELPYCRNKEVLMEQLKMIRERRKLLLTVSGETRA
eukprot:GFYU01003132.1.p1 GENE.GFYU01003132.1~~GFYU01003132.1.p1  ORF type:complete len:1292 (-),score=264.84 GFYU01003132.1:120-3995(-)